MVRKAFDNDATFVAAMDRACKKFVNSNAVTKAARSSTKSPELLAKYCHGLLKKGSKIAEGQDVEALLDGVMLVFQYLDDSDVFQKYYSKMLAQRLVNSASESDDYESSMISKLKQKCGYEWTQKFQRMFTDIGTSRTMMTSFKEGVLAKSILKGFTMMVLQSNSWPFTSTDGQLRLPEVLQKCREKFETYYHGQHQGRKLMWRDVGRRCGAAAGCSHQNAWHLRAALDETCGPTVKHVARREARWCRSTHVRQLAHNHGGEAAATAPARPAADASSYRAWLTQRGSVLAKQMMSLLHAYDEKVSSYWAGEICRTE